MERLTRKESPSAYLSTALSYEFLSCVLSAEEKGKAKIEPNILGPGLAISLFGAKIDSKILGTRACDVTLWSKK